MHASIKNSLSPVKRAFHFHYLPTSSTDQSGCSMQSTRRDKFDSASFSRHNSRPNVSMMNVKIDAFGQGGRTELHKGKSELSTYNFPMELLSKSSNDAMEFLSRTWSPSSFDFFKMLSLNVREHGQQLEQQQTEESITPFSEDDKTKSGHVTSLLSTGNLLQPAVGKHKQVSTGWISAGRLKAWLDRELLAGFSRGCRARRKERLRLHAAQIHAALSVARLASATAHIMANSRAGADRANGSHGSGEPDERLSYAVASAAALIATVCAEAAETVGAGRECIASAITAGRAAKTSAEMAILAATAATCLRGAATLELRAAATRHVPEEQKVLSRGAQLPVKMPQGKIQVRSVYFFFKHDKLTVRLAKKHLRGVISRYKEWEDLQEGFSKDDHGFYLMTFGTTGGTIQIMFEDQMLYRIWRSSICSLLCHS